YYRYARGDGKADLWRKRHAIRYISYLVGSVLLWQSGRGGWRGQLSAMLLLLGGVAYLKRPFQRLALQTRSRTEFLLAAPLVPLVRLIGDVAKMAGYPVGVLWRLRSPQK
ncbi:MAG TPA: glycosyl transferase, partial [Chloroflexota bacterium]|nr:glycosyl transferase [Chloroflexota bacterium]